MNGIVFNVLFLLCLLLVNRKTTEFCICILYPMGLLGVWLDGSFLRPFFESLESHTHRTVSCHPQAMIS